MFTNRRFDGHLRQRRGFGTRQLAGFFVLVYGCLPTEGLMDTCAKGAALDFGFGFHFPF